MKKREMGALLERKLAETTSIAPLSRWAFRLYFDNIREIDESAKDVLFDLGRMEDAPKFEYSIDELRNLVSELKNSSD